MPTAGPDRVDLDASGLPPVERLGLLARFRKGTLPGNVLAALWRRRRAPAIAAAATRASLRERGWRPPPRSGRRSYPAVYVVLAGPGDWPALAEVLDSLARYEPDAKAVVVDDATTDCRERRVRAAYPDVDVVRRRWPSLGPPRNFPPLAHGLRWALEEYDFEVLGKLDTDALVTGEGPSRVAAGLFERDPRIGMAGTYRLRGDGVPEDYGFDAFVLRQTRRWSPTARRLLRRAEAGGYDGAKVHGGVYYVSRAALEAVARGGWLRWRTPWWTQLSEDFWLSVMVQASGFQLGSLGGPGEPLLVASKHLPLPKEQVLAEGKLAVHSVRRGSDGESEEELRAFFRQARTAPAPSSPESAPPGR
jgi:hypothetical protein